MFGKVFTLMVKVTTITSLLTSTPFRVICLNDFCKLLITPSVPLPPQALSAADLSLVLYACETIDSQQVFGQTPCPLSQPVLLSLIQQLSSNLSTHSELKIRWGQRADGWASLIFFILPVFYEGYLKFPRLSQVNLWFYLPDAYS